MEVTPHDQFATLLALVLPDPVLSRPGTFNPGENLTQKVVAGARTGYLYRCGRDNNWPYYFTAPEYCGHLLPVVQELWRKCYLAE